MLVNEGRILVGRLGIKRSVRRGRGGEGSALLVAGTNAGVA